MGAYNADQNHKDFAKREDDKSLSDEEKFN